jgi:multiple sugar transport system permease protein
MKPWEWRQRWIDRIAILVLAVAVFIYMAPIYWIGVTSLKPTLMIHSRVPPLLFPPTLEHYRDLVWNVKTIGGRERVLGPSEYLPRFWNSVVIGGISTLLAVALGTMTAYAFSRFKVKGQGDWMFFILSTRMLPPVVVVIPIFLMYRALGLLDTHAGLILLYTVFNVSFAVWLMKGFIDEIPKEYEEAALLDGYTRLQAFRKVTLPQSVTAIAATAVFCLITAWNEFTFALLLTTRSATTAPPTIANAMGASGLDWGQVAAGAAVFLLPVAFFTFLMRNHLLRGITFGAIKK